MASINSRFDATPTVAKDSTDGPWLTTYSRGLCSLYPKDEDCCWDALLSSQISEERSSSPFGNELLEPRIDHSDSNRYQSRPQGSKTLSVPSKEVSEPAISSGATVYSKTENAQLAALPSTIGWNHRNRGQESAQLSAAMTSPQGGRLPHALCSLGFDCIDFITATGTPEEPAATSSSETALDSSPLANPRSLAQRLSTIGVGSGNSSREQLSLEAESRIQEDLGEAGLEEWAAAVCGKRTAALERKRLLSRTFSQNSLEPANHDPWFETLDRLSRWDEVAYR